MTNPRNRITLDPPPARPMVGTGLPAAQSATGTVIRPAASPPTRHERSAGPPRSSAAVGDRLIGKAHGKMRSVGLYLPAAAAARLRQLAADQDLPLGEALMAQLADIDHTDISVRRRRLRVEQPTTVYVLLVEHDAAHLHDLCTRRSTSASGIATAALSALDSPAE